MAERRGYLIAFEGIDGCGKSTQAELLLQALKGAGIPCVLVREPGSTPVAESVRSILLHATDMQLSAETELLLYCVARADLYHRCVVPKLKQGITVVSDRCFWASVAYQGAALGLGVERTRSLCLFATQGTEPDLVVVLDLPVSEAQKRLRSKPDRIEARGAAYAEKVRAGFLAQAQRFPDRSAVLPATESIEKTHRNVRRCVETLMNRKL